MKSRPHSRYFFVHCPLLIVNCFAAAGCSDGLPRVYPVKGKIVNKGKGPATDLAGYGVQLQSTTDPAERPGGQAAEDGTFTLYTRVGGRVIPGVKEGTYQAYLTLPATEGNSQPRLLVPKRYTAPDTAELQVVVSPAGAADLTLELDRDAKK